MADLVHLSAARPTDWNDDACPGALAYFYAAGTTDPITVYRDAGAALAHPSPVEADGFGAFPAIYATADVDVLVTNEDGDTLPGYPRACVRVPQSASGAGSVTFSPTEAIAETNVQAAIEAVQSNVEGLGSAGFLARRLNGDFVGRALGGTADQITISNNTGDGGNPIFALVLATQVQAEEGTNATRAMTALRVAQAITARALPLTAGYTSPATVIAPSTAYTLAHGLVTVPRIIECRLVCETVDTGFAVGDEVVLATMQDSSTNGVLIYANATNVVVTFAANYAGYSPSGYAAFDLSKWRLVVRAWK